MTIFIILCVHFFFSLFIGSLSTVSQQQTQSTVSTNGLSQFSIKPSTTMVSDMSKTEIIIPSDPGNGVNGSKEKTPMCLVNELARFNKVSLNKLNFNL